MSPHNCVYDRSSTNAIGSFHGPRCCITVGWSTQFQFRIDECIPCVQCKYRPLDLNLGIRSKYSTAAFRGVRVQARGLWLMHGFPQTSLDACACSRAPRTLLKAPKWFWALGDWVNQSISDYMAFSAKGRAECQSK
jgi:hypothetical protein